MTYFSRLTDIVTCNLTQVLNTSDQPAAVLEELILEMEEGLAGARRSVQTAQGNSDRLIEEIDELRRQIAQWKDDARLALSENREADARSALERKKELEDVSAGLEQELQAAISTRDHLETTLRALQGRLADARRKRVELSGDVPATPTEYDPSPPIESRTRVQAIEDELDALRRELDNDQ